MTWLLRSIISACVLACSCQSSREPKVNSATSEVALSPSKPYGTAPGAAGVDLVGNATYSIPIEPAPGPRGMEPRYSLQYSSGRGSGLAGIGWELAGVSSIHRCRDTIADDGKAGPAQHHLCLDGDRLIVEELVPGYGADGATYRPRRDPTTRVTAIGEDVDEDSMFVVQTADGRTLYYGEGYRSRLLKGDWPYRWMLTRAVDQFGNKIEYTYFLPSNGQGDPVAALPNAAHYAFDAADQPTRMVQFEYELRPDTDIVRTWVTARGAEQRLDRRLKAINVRAAGALVRRFELDYMPVDETNTRRSLLEEVRQCDGAGVCKPPTRFTWELGTPGFENVDMVGEHQADFDPVWGRSAILDMDGDGRHEIVYARDPVYVPKDVHNPGLSVDLAQTWSIWRPDMSWYSTLYLAWAAAGRMWIQFDQVTQPDFDIHAVNFNGDARDDLIVPAHMCHLPDGGVFCFGDPNWAVALGVYACGLDLQITGSWTPGNGVTLGICYGVGLTITLQRGYEEYDGIDGQNARYATGFYVLTGENYLFSQVLPVDDGSNKKIYSFYTADLDGDSLDDVLFCRGTNAENAYWVRGLNRVTDGVHHFEFTELVARCSIGDAVMFVDADNDGAVEPLVSPVRMLGPLPEKVPTGYRILGGSYGMEVLPVDWLARSFHANCSAHDPRSDRRHRGLGYDKLLDWNGDGLVDVLRFELKNEELVDWNDPKVASCEFDAPSVLRIYYNTGAGFVRGPHVVTFDHDPYESFWNRFVPAQTADWDGNGKVDVLLPRGGDVGESVEWDVVLSYGEVWETVGSGIHWPVAGPNETRARITSAIDVNGDGLHDLVFKRGTETDIAWNADMEILIHRGARPDVITAVVDGLGARDEFTYGVTTDREIHTPTAPSDCVRPRVCSSEPRLVVASHKQDLGLEDNSTVERRYHYGGLLSDGHGRGALGFASIQIDESAPGDTFPRTTVLEFDRQYDAELADHPKAGYVASRKEQALYFHDGKYHLRVQHRNSTWTVEKHPLADGTSYLVRKSGEVVSEYQLDGMACGDPGAVCGDSDVAAKPPVRQVVMTFDADAFGHVTRAEFVTSDGHRRLIERDHEDDLASWRLGLLKWERITSTAANGSTERRYAEVIKRHPNGAIDIMDVEPQDDQYRLRIDYGYDAHGNVSSTSRREYVHNSTLVTSTTWDPLGIYPMSHTDAAGLIHTFAFDPGLGVLTQYVRPSGVTLISKYDGFGRPSGTNRTKSLGGVSDGGWSTITFIGPSDYPGSVYRVSGDTNGRPVRTIDYDRLGRPIRELRDGFIGEGDPDGYEDPYGDVYRTFHYDHHGRLARRSTWTALDEQPSGYDRFTYDELDRPVSHQAPDGATTFHSYPTLLRHVITDPDGHQQERIFDAAGDPIMTMNGERVQTCYEWGPFGVLDRVTRDCHAAGLKVEVDYQYDRYGRLTGFTKPDLGSRTYRYDPFGRLVWSTDGEGHEVSYERDGVGRLLSRTDADGTTTFTWDVTRPGLLTESTNSSGVTRRFSYDDFDRLKRETTVIGTESFSFEYAYDSFARLHKIAYPSGTGQDDLGFTWQLQPGDSPDKTAVTPGLVLEIVYDSHGYEREVRNADTRLAYWTATKATPSGSITEHRFGNGVITNRTYHPGSERLDFIRTLAPNVGAIQLEDHAWTPGGDLLWRDDQIAGQREEMSYDRAHRLRHQRITGGASPVERETRFDALDNITFRTELGDVSYDGQLLTAAGGHSFSWDADGRLEQRDGVDLTYTSFDKVATLSSATLETTMTYDADQQLVRRVDSDGRTIWYIGELYEREKSKSSSVTERFKIPTPEGPAAVVTRTVTAGTVSHRTYYLHPDYLGSPRVITDAAGAVVGQLSFGPWGERRNPINWGSTVAANASPNQPNVGFTSHEQRDLFGLINMRGRLYDPQVGRFMSPDPRVAARFAGIGYQPYAYAFNNPFRYIDPNGMQGQEVRVVLTDVDGQVCPCAREVNVDVADPVVTVRFGTFTFPVDQPTIADPGDRGPGADTRGGGGGSGIQSVGGAGGVGGGGRFWFPSFDIGDGVIERAAEEAAEIIIENKEAIAYGVADGATLGVSTAVLQELGVDVPTNDPFFIASSLLVPGGGEIKAAKAIGGRIIGATKALPPVGGTSVTITREMRWMQLANDPHSRLSKELIDHIRRHNGANVRSRFGLELAHRVGKPSARRHDYAEAVPAWVADHRGIQHRYVTERRTGTTIRTALKPRSGGKLDLPPKGALP